jgi:hypothetical protein
LFRVTCIAKSSGTKALSSVKAEVEKREPKGRVALEKTAYC